jgi:hypothetical protein
MFVAGLEKGVVLAPVEPSDPPVVRVSKLGNQIQFDIENGKKSHKVVRSTDPRRVEAHPGLEMTNGSYAERLHDGANLVFYRID